MYKVIKITVDTIYLNSAHQILEIPTYNVNFPIHVGDVVEVFIKKDGTYALHPIDRRAEYEEDKGSGWFVFVAIMILIVGGVGIILFFNYSEHRKETIFTPTNFFKTTKISKDIEEEQIDQSSSSSEVSMKPSTKDSSAIQEPPKVTVANIPSKGTMRVTVAGLNVREKPDSSSNSVWLYKNGDVVNYDTVQVYNGYIWVSYRPHNSNIRRYVAAGLADGSQMYGTFAYEP